MMFLDEKTNLERKFLADITQNPKDLFTLSVYADWLMDQPESADLTRGEYLRLECLLTGKLSAQQRQDLHWRQHSLWWNHVETWLGPLYDAVDHFIYERGQLVIEISERTFCSADSDLLAECPAWYWVTDILIREGSFSLIEYLMALPKPPFLTVLDVGRKTLLQGDLTLLLEQGVWENLDELILRGNSIDDGDIRSLASWPGLSSLRELDLRNTLTDWQGAESLAGSPFVKQLGNLDLRNTPASSVPVQERPKFPCRVWYGFGSG